MNTPAPTRTGTVLAKGNKTDPYAQRWTVQEIDGDLYYYNKSIGDWCSLPTDWTSRIIWDVPNNLTPDPEHDVTGNGTESHYGLARQLEMRGYEVRANNEDNEHSEVYFEDRHVGDIHGDNPATVTNC